MIKPPYAKKRFERICEQQRPKSACADAQADQGICCSLTETFITVKSIDKIIENYADPEHAQTALNFRYRLCIKPVLV